MLPRANEWYNQQLVNSQSHNTQPVCSADNDQFETCLENRRPGQLEFQLRYIQLYHFTTIRRPSLNFMQLLIQYQWTENCLYDGKLADFCQWCARTRETDRQTGRHTYRQTYIQTYRQTDRQTHRQTDTQTDRQTHRQTYRQTDTQTHRRTDRQWHWWPQNSEQRSKKRKTSMKQCKP